ncbi:MAG: FMN-binding protein, partial [Candidatus Margulisbacteria bacterium]|nr:FMN-binding protein [Candidatus Margulisiibacteriota bacterium]
QKENIEKIYKDYIFEKTVDGQLNYYSKKDYSYAYILAGSGFWGPIEALLGLTYDQQTIKGFYVLEQEETPGLGGRISEENFQKQFIGKSIKPKLSFVPAGTSKGDPNKVDAITGATMTSRALEKIINMGPK